MGLHQRYALLLEGQQLPFIAGRKEEEEKVRRELSHLFDGMMKALYQEEGAEFRIEVLEQPEMQSFMEKHSETLNSSFKQVEMSDTMRRRLERSNYIFSGFKTFHELNEAFPSLIDENGNRKPFEQFLNEVRKIDETYNSNYLRSEYNFIQSSATMAAKWEEFMEDGDRYNLQYRTAGDSKVRPTHAELNRITLPMSDPFWEEFYPPNGWNCRCTVVQVRKSKYPVTPHEEAMALGEAALERDTKGIFRFNPGKEEKAVPDYNPYTIRRCRDCDIAKGKLELARSIVSDNELCAACRFIRTCEAERCDRNLRPYKNNLIKDIERSEKSYSNLNTGMYYLTRKSFKRAIGHAYDMDEADRYVKANEHIADWQFIRISQLGEGKDRSNPKDIANIRKKEERHVTAYNIYELHIQEEVWIIKTEVYKGYKETVYHIIKKE